MFWQEALKYSESPQQGAPGGDLDDALSYFASVNKGTVRGPPEEACRHSAHQLAKGRVQVSVGNHLNEMLLNALRTPSSLASDGAPCLNLVLDYLDHGARGEIPY